MLKQESLGGFLGGPEAKVEGSQIMVQTWLIGGSPVVGVSQSL
jgi:hypothetical protein